MRRQDDEKIFLIHIFFTDAGVLEQHPDSISESPKIISIRINKKHIGLNSYEVRDINNRDMVFSVFTDGLFNNKITAMVSNAQLNGKKAFDKEKIWSEYCVGKAPNKFGL